MKPEVCRPGDGPASRPHACDRGRMSWPSWDPPKATPDYMGQTAPFGPARFCEILQDPARSCKILVVVWSSPGSYANIAAMTTPALILLARRAASAYGLPPELVCAVAEQESAWRPAARRYEPAFAARYGPAYRKSYPACPYLDDARFYSSLGLMQVMGSVAWEHNFRGDLNLLLDPETNLSVGCRVLAAKLRIAGWDGSDFIPESVVRRGLMLWNGGGRRAYAGEVLARVRRYVQPAGPVPEPEQLGGEA